MTTPDRPNYIRITGSGDALCVTVGLSYRVVAWDGTAPIIRNDNGHLFIFPAWMPCGPPPTLDALKAEKKAARCIVTDLDGLASDERGPGAALRAARYASALRLLERDAAALDIRAFRAFTRARDADAIADALADACRTYAYADAIIAIRAIPASAADDLAALRAEARDHNARARAYNARAALARRVASALAEQLPSSPLGFTHRPAREGITPAPLVTRCTPRLDAEAAALGGDAAS